MKDSYTFDRDRGGPRRRRTRSTSYAYDRMMDRCGLEWYRVEADVGMMGGLGAHEYMAPCAAGENEVALAAGYAANVEVASADAQPVTLPPPLDAPELVETPGMTTVEEVAGALELPEAALLKAFPVIVDDGAMKLVVVRGDHRVNEIKLRHALGADFRPAHPDEVEQRLGPPGFIGPVGTDVADPARRGGRAGGLRDRRQPPRRATCGASSRAATSSTSTVDVRTVVGRRHGQRLGDPDRAGDRGRQHLQARHAATRSRWTPPTSTSRAREQLIWMGSYGFGPARAAAAAVEQYADEQGISWPRDDRAVRRRAGRAGQGGKRGARARRPAVRGAARPRPRHPLRRPRRRTRGRSSPTPSCSGARCGSRSAGEALAAGEVEVQIRRGRESRTVPLEGAARGDRGGVAGAALSTRASRLTRTPAVRDRPLRPAAGGDARRGSRCNPWTLPNAIGFARLAGIPVFLVVALSSERRPVDALAAVLFAVIGWADYLDGFVARLTGQYSRLGALLDPVVDRLLVISGMAVCWRFELLPRWAIALVVARELFVLALSRYGLRHGRRAADQLAGPARRRADDGRPVLRDARGPLARAGAALPGPGAGAGRDGRCTFATGLRQLRARKALKLSLTLSTRRLYCAARASLSWTGGSNGHASPTSAR